MSLDIQPGRRFALAASKVAASACLAVASLGASAQDKVQFLLDLIPSSEYAAYYAGVANGFYKEQNIDMSIGRGYGSGDTVSKVAAGAAPFGIADIAPALTGRAKAGVPVKVLSSMYVFSPHSIFVLESSGIKTLKDLQGKRIGITPGNSHKYYFPEVAKRVGIDESKIEWVNVDASSMASLLISERLDAVPLPVNDPLVQLLQSEDGSAVHNVMVGGRWAVRNRQLQNIRLSQLREDAAAASRRLLQGGQANEALYRRLLPVVQCFCPALMRQPYRVDRFGSSEDHPTT